MPLNHYLTLGHSGLAVSPLCLGAMTFGEDWGWGSSVKESEAIMDTFMGRGGNFIDTANAYTRGHSEKIIGDHIGRHPARRQRAVIATKFSSNPHTRARGSKLGAVEARGDLHHHRRSKRRAVRGQSGCARFETARRGGDRAERSLEVCSQLPRRLRSRRLDVRRGGTTVNGETAAPWPLSPKTDAERH